MQRVSPFLKRLRIKHGNAPHSLATTSLAYGTSLILHSTYHLVSLDLESARFGCPRHGRSQDVCYGGILQWLVLSDQNISSEKREYLRQQQQGRHTSNAEPEPYAPLFPFLRSLSLRGECCQKRDLLEFFRRHSGSLQQVSLENITLVASKISNPQPASESGLGDESVRTVYSHTCWISVLKELRRMLSQLKSISFAGYLNNAGLQLFEIHVNHNHEGTEALTLAQRVSEWILNSESRESDCPLDLLAVPQGAYDISAEMVTCQDNLGCDESWRLSAHPIDWLEALYASK